MASAGPNHCPRRNPSWTDRTRLHVSTWHITTAKAGEVPGASSRTPYTPKAAPSVRAVDARRSSDPFIPAPRPSPCPSLLRPIPVSGDDPYWFRGQQFRLRCRAPLETQKRSAAVIADYRQAAELAPSKAGFDGVKLHAATGYLPHQFQASNFSNRRTDTLRRIVVVNRARFTLRSAGGPLPNLRRTDRVGIKIAPGLHRERHLRRRPGRRLIPIWHRQLNPLGSGVSARWL